MTRKTPAATSTALGPPAVDGLQPGRKVARRRAARRRVKNMITSGVMFVLVGSVVGAAGYYGYQFFVAEQDNNSVDGPTAPSRSTEEFIEHLEQQPKWNGPGNPSFGVGEDQP